MDQVQGLFNGGKLAPAILKEHERALLTKLQGCTIDHPAMSEEVRFECPALALEPLRRRSHDAFGQEMAAQMANRGHVIACDVLEGCLKRGAERFRQAGLHNIEARLLTGETDRWVKRHRGGFDRVLVDAPCSGTGTWRCNPDARWRTLEDQNLGNLLALQARILASAARLVRSGGRLVYATCSMLPEENEQQVAAFLAAYPAFEAVPLSETPLRQISSAHPDYLSLTPARHDTDGFFAAVMQRKTAPSAE